MWWKQSFYRGSVGVPLSFSQLGQVAEDSTIQLVTSLLDIGPTLVEIAGGSPMQNVRGRSLCQFLQPDIFDNGN